MKTSVTECVQLEAYRGNETHFLGENEHAHGPDNLHAQTLGQPPSASVIKNQLPRGQLQRQGNRGCLTTP